ncbi:TIGR01777 family oxidoreductase [Bacillus sp. Bva_UNVM-123]|uniref:TIGR01777 family oxidoreductase n=1 Tax=Bacillus sp. Bva_UNVM-123 TaxID=2829798 RepID=UPI00391FBEF5
MKIAITGGTGFVGQALIRDFIEKGYTLFILTRSIQNKVNNKQITYLQWLNDGDKPEEALEGIDVLINLAGESINSGRWTEERKQRIIDSRISATKEVLRIINSLKKKPYTMINASAIGYYGTSRTEILTESSERTGTDFLAKTVQQWEAEAKKAQEFGCRTVYCRFGIILDQHDGALPRIAFPYKMFVGGTVGSGEQWLSWIHIADVVNAIHFVLLNTTIEGAVNFTAPNPATMKEFGKTLGEVLHRPHWIPAPASALKAGLGEMSILVLEGQKVLPEKLIKSGYPFLFKQLKDALLHLY